MLFLQQTINVVESKSLHIFFPVFWRSYKGDVHYATSGVLNSMFGALYGAVVLALFYPFSSSYEVQCGLIFLGLIMHSIDNLRLELT